MAKNISLADDVYEKLNQLKKKNESFSDVIRRLFPPKGMLQDIAGNKTFSREEWNTVENAFNKRKKIDIEQKNKLLEMQR